MLTRINFIKICLVAATVLAIFSFTEIKPRVIRIGKYTYLVKPEVARDKERGITIYYTFYRLFKNGKTNTRKEECGYVEYVSCGVSGNGNIDVLNDTLLIEHYYQERFTKADTNFFLLDTTVTYYQPNASGKLVLLQIIQKPERIDTLHFER